ncbi:sugar ABC transporter ATP-binding protein [Ruicaihuangia caeni]|uniref:Sugar ABC transporter ATP-binding protein n=1 Tax=Ruicaihuangia caeni TaxID=3042517 RepID=A0AAW6T2Q2_9MICO|nr:sugar ABC transporter ATP-binding protein [Klugiella sp. YN-L-19]MDI2097381.1 sugar ABC transporter ATP-binding protein [Klugiella sp. YN-L-19]
MDGEVIQHHTPGGLGAAESSRTAPFVEISQLSKRFGATVALRSVSFDIRKGETLGLLGANGAGKSTLIKILSGLQPATSGTVSVQGEGREFTSPNQAQQLGIVTVHQNIDDGVVFGMTVAENLMLDTLGLFQPNPFLTYRKIRRRARALLEELELELPLDLPVEQLSASDRQQVSIGRALAKSPNLLILDEPTSTLSSREAELLFGAVRDLQYRGISVLYVSHRMSEIEELCHRAVVLRNGSVVSEHQQPLDLRAVTQSILGDLASTSLGAGRQHAPGDVVMRLRGVRSGKETAPFDLEVRRGEVLGVTGLVGAGKTELLEQLAGTRPLESGVITLNGSEYKPKSVADAIAKGVVMMPEERAVQAIFPDESVSRHLSIGRMGKVSRLGFMDRARERSFAEQVIAKFAVKAAGPDAAIETLSGGNQQKALVGRWLVEQQSLVILDEPFRGVDIGARAVIATELHEYSERAAVIVASSDPEEVLEVADRVLVMVDGRIVSDSPAFEMNSEALADAMSEVQRTTTSGAPQS